MKNRSAKRSGTRVIIIGIFFIILAGVGYVYTSDKFERELPQIQGKNNVFWNLKDPLKINLSDTTGLKSFELILSDGQKSIIVGKKVFDTIVKKQTLLIKYPKSKVLDRKAKKLTLKVIVTDSSKWNFFQGNTNKKIIDIQIDHKKPNVNILSNSYSITQGGAALVIFQAEDENLDALYIEAGGKKFQVQRYKKEGYYVSLIAWPFKQNSFQAKVVAIDAAQNKRIQEVPLYLKKYKYKVSWIKAKDKFIDGKITDLTTSDSDYADIDDKLEKLKAINEDMRLKNENLIHALSSKISSEILYTWEINKFYPLRNGQRVASYGDERHYYYKTKDNIVSHSYHVGYDLASTKMADIKTSNAGRVVYANENGIYGNMPMIDHGLGLFSLYGHCATMLVNEGDEVSVGQVIAKTGTSGLALGDHLHFGILVQGIEVRPVEWFDKSWIRKNIDNIFKVADKIIQVK